MRFKKKGKSAEPKLYGDLIYKLIRIVGNTDISEPFVSKR